MLFLKKMLAILDDLTFVNLLLDQIFFSIEAGQNSALFATKEDACKALLWQTSENNKWWKIKYMPNLNNPLRQLPTSL